LSLGELKHTPFYEMHLRENARIVPFVGWEMPIQYPAGIVAEHSNVRNSAGMFDVSHMGEIALRGKEALEFAQRLVTNDVMKLLVDGKAIYSPMCYENGTIVDDLLVYRKARDDLMLVVNASNTDKDFEWVRKKAGKFDVGVENISDEVAEIALQGPRAEAILQKFTDYDLPSMGKFRFNELVLLGDVRALVSRTGYTGEDGFEIYFEPEFARRVWTALRNEGAEPAGLGARDTLRLEAGMMLYGNDIDDTTTPLEATIGWTVRFGTGFIGEEALEKQGADGIEKKLVGFEMVEQGVARHGFKVFDGEGEIGYVTSGTFSPTLKKPIGMAYVPPGHPGEFEVEVRETVHKRAEIADLPFYRRR
jgi:aminomethyltransferase